MLSENRRCSFQLKPPVTKGTITAPITGQGGNNKICPDYTDGGIPQLDRIPQSDTAIPPYASKAGFSLRNVPLIKGPYFVQLRKTHDGLATRQPGGT